MRRIWITFICLMFPLMLAAQGPISFGPKIGWNSDRLTTDYTQYVQDMRNGWQGGLFVSLYMGRVYLQPEAYFSVKRGALETSFGDPYNPGSTLNITQTINLKSVDVPFLLGYKLLDLKLARLRIWGGPVGSFLLDKQYVLSINGLNRSERITADDFRDGNWSVQFGAGLDLLMFTVDVGYEIGLNRFLTIESLDDLSFRNNLFFCSLGWRIL